MGKIISNKFSTMFCFEREIKWLYSENFIWISFLSLSGILNTEWHIADVANCQSHQGIYVYLRLQQPFLDQI